MNAETNELLAVWAALTDELSKAPPSLNHPTLAMQVDSKGGIAIEIRWSEVGVPPQFTVVADYWYREMWLHQETLVSMARYTVDHFRRLHVRRLEGHAA